METIEEGFKLRDIDSLESIDVAKLLCAYLVISIHVSVFGNGYNRFAIYGNFFIHLISRLAVPFFFVCSGFFLFRKMDEHSINFSAIKNYLRRIAMMYVFWSIAYLPLNCIKYGLFRDELTVISVLKYIYQCLFVFSYTHLWYLLGLAYAILAVAMMLRFGRLRTTIVIGLVLYCFGLLNQGYHGFIEPFEEQKWGGVFINTLRF